MTKHLRDALKHAEQVRIGDVAKTGGGSTPSRSRHEYWAEPGQKGLAWVRTAEIAFDPISKTQEAVSDVALRECSLAVGQPGTVLVAMFGEGKTRGQSAVLNIEATFNQACFAIFPNETFDPDYLQLWLRGQYHELRRLALGRGGSQANLNGSILADLRVPWVEKSRQRQVVAALREQLAVVSTGCIAARQQLAELDLLPQKLLGQVFTERWSKCRLGDSCTKIGSGSTPRGGYKSYLANGIPLIRSQNVLMRTFVKDGLAHICSETHDEMAGTEVMPGDVLLNITGASIGRVCVVPDDVPPANVNQHVCIIRCTRLVDPHFLMFYLSSPRFQKHIDDTQAGGTRQALTKSDIEDFMIPKMDIAEQHAVSAHLREQLRQVEVARLGASHQFAELELLPQKLLAQVFQC